MMDRRLNLVREGIGRENCGEQIALVRKSKTACAWHVCTRLWLMFRIGEEYKRGHEKVRYRSQGWNLVRSLLVLGDIFVVCPRSFLRLEITS